MKRIFILFVFTCILTSAKSQTIKEVTDYFGRGELEKAYTLSSELIKLDSLDKVAIHMHGRVLADLGKHHEAVPYLLKSIELDCSKTEVTGWAHGVLGQCYFMLGKYKESEDALKKCIQLNSTPNSVKYAEKRMFAYGFDKYFSKWTIVETEHIRFHIQKADKYTNLEVFTKQREDAFVKIQNELGSQLPKKIDFFVWVDKKEPMKKFKMNLGFANPETACIYSHSRQTVGHEITHVLSHYIGKNLSKTGLINEGIAVYFNMESGEKMDQLKKVMESKNYKNLKVMDFWYNFRDYNDEISYPFAGAFMEKLVKTYGIENLKPLLVNQTYESALAIYGTNFKTVIEEFEKEVNQAL